MAKRCQTNHEEYQFWNLIPRDLGISFSTLRSAAMISGRENWGRFVFFFFCGDVGLNIDSGCISCWRIHVAMFELLAGDSG